MARLPRGQLVNRSGHRTRLAIAYDPYASALITAAVEAGGGWVTRVVRSVPGAPRDRGGLTTNERAFQQALYYDRRIYLWGGGFEEGVRIRNPARTHALQVQWSRLRLGARGQTYRPAGGGTARLVRVRVHAIGEASLYASEHYA